MKQYLDLLRDILENGESHDDRTGVGTLSVFGRQIRFDLRQGFPLVTTKKVFMRGIAEELRWFLSGDTNAQTLKDKDVHIWDAWATKEQCAKFGREENDLGPVYGHAWRNFGATPEDCNVARVDVLRHRHVCPGFAANGIDQIRKVLSLIMDNPGSRRIIVSGWDPREAEGVALPPCHTLFQFKVHEATNELSCELYARSIDAFLGLPFNIAEYALLLSLVAKATRRTPRELIISFGDVHIYKNHIDQVKEQLTREPRALPQLLVPVPSARMPTSMEYLLSWEWKPEYLIGYDPHPAIKAPVAV